MHKIRVKTAVLLLGAVLVAVDGAPENKKTYTSVSASQEDAGCALPSGRDGRDGIPGQPGRDGIPGVPGPAGPAGYRGEKGTEGERGTKGDQGLTGLMGPPGNNAGGVVYTRWGRNCCPGIAGTMLVYSGRVGGSWYCDKGGAANYLCMPDDPQYDSYQPGVQGRSFVYGAEYQTNDSPLQHVYDDNVPCAVCHVADRDAVLMIPAKKSCPQGWVREYYGYLMSSTILYEDKRTMFECIDRNPDTVPGQGENTQGAVFHHNEANCNGMDCPPYDPEKELTCVVCTK